jgi:hypothetical protein
VGVRVGKLLEGFEEVRPVGEDRLGVVGQRIIVVDSVGEERTSKTESNHLRGPSSRDVEIHNILPSSVLNPLQSER